MEQRINPDARWHPAVRVLVFFIAYFVLISIVEFGFLILFASQTGASLQEIQQSLVSGRQFGLTAIVKGIEFGFLLLFAWFFARKIDRIPLREFGFRWYPGELFIGAGYGILLILAAYIVYIIAGFAQISGFGTAGMTTSALVWQVVLGFVALIIAAIHEELLARGYILRNFMQTMNNWVALIVTGLIFSGMHLLNPNLEILGLINIFLAGILFGVYYIHRKNLWFPIGLHFTWNFFQGMVFGIPVSGQKMPSILSTNVSGPEILTGGKFGIEASLIGTVILIAAILGFQLYYGKHPEIPPEETGV